MSTNCLSHAVTLHKQAITAAHSSQAQASKRFEDALAPMTAASCRSVLLLSSLHTWHSWYACCPASKLDPHFCPTLSTQDLCCHVTSPPLSGLIIDGQHLITTCDASPAGTHITMVSTAADTGNKHFLYKQNAAPARLGQLNLLSQGP